MLYVSLNKFISEALCQPSNLIAYSVSQRLTELFPKKAILETTHYAFDVEVYAEANQCTLELGTYSFNQVLTRWVDADEEEGEAQLAEFQQNGWYRVNWRGFGLEVLTMHWDNSYHYWILADIKEMAENFMVSVCDWNASVRSDTEILVFEAGSWAKDEALVKAIKDTTFENLVLENDLGQGILSDLQRFYNSKEVYKNYGLPWKRGVLLVGPPGNGKTHAVKALVNSLGKPCIYVKSFRDNSYDEEANIKRVYERARKLAPCLIVLEDLDSQLTAKNRSFFLNELDGFASNNGILTLATTNYPEKLDPAITQRPSRFDRKYHFGLPGEVVRAAYLSRWNSRLQPEMQLSEGGIARVAGQTSEFSFAYLKELMVSSMMAWIDRQPGQTMNDLIGIQLANLREQMVSEPPPEEAPQSEED